MRKPPIQRPPASPPQRASSWKRAVTPEQILRSFSTRAFKRERPDKPKLMLQFVAQAHACRAPISFVQYWGKGLRPTLAAPEFACLDFLESMMSRIVEIFQPDAPVHAGLHRYARRVQRSLTSKHPVVLPRSGARNARSPVQNLPTQQSGERGRLAARCNAGTAGSAT